MKPAGCPRDRDGGLGPRECPYARECEHHNLRELLGRRGRGRPADPARAAAALELGDDCMLDVADRARLDGELVPWAVVGLHLGVSRQAAAQEGRAALRKLKKLRSAISRALAKARNR